MAILEIRKGLRRLNFTPRDDAKASPARTHVLVEFEVTAQLAADQLVLINLGLRDGVRRELQGRPRLITQAAGQTQSFTYRLEGDVA